MKKFALLLLATLVTGCASYSSEITPASISTLRYSNFDCETLKNEKVFIEESLAKTSEEQDDAADRDTLMVFLIGIPTSGGGVKGEVARLKGENIAVQKAIIQKKCM